jgi:hypothetical protein
MRNLGEENVTHNPLSRDRSMGRVSLRTLLNCAIEALLAQEPIQTQLSRVDPYITELEQHRSELPDGCWETLDNAVAILACSKNTNAANHGTDDYLSPEQELDLTEELLALHLHASGGALIF